MKPNEAWININKLPRKPKCKLLLSINVNLCSADFFLLHIPQILSSCYMIEPSLIVISVLVQIKPKWHLKLRKSLVIWHKCWHFGSLEWAKLQSFSIIHRSLCGWCWTSCVWFSASEICSSGLSFLFQLPIAHHQSLSLFVHDNICIIDSECTQRLQKSRD